MLEPPQTMRFVLRALARLLLNAPVAGVITIGLAYLYCMWGPLVPADEVLLGKSAEQISSYVAVRFAGEIRAVGLALGALAVGLGLALGVVALALLVLRDAARGVPRRPRTGVRAALAAAGVVLVLELGALFASMARWPQLYSPAFYARGGVLAWLQILVTDRLGSRGVAALFGVAVAVVVFGSPTAWPEHAARIGRSLATQPRRVAGALALTAFVGFARWAAGREAPIQKAMAPPAPRRSDATRRPNVLVLAADGLRVDRLRPEVAPRLTAIAEQGTRFDRAYVSVPRTMCSWTTMLTGLHPHHHGLRSAFPRWEDVTAPRDALPARLRAAGYATAVVSDYAGDVFRKAEFGFSTNRAPKWDFAGLLWQRGIQRATPLLPFLQTRPGRALLPELQDMGIAADPRFVAEDAIDVLRQVSGRPFFMLVFFSTTHFPYAAPAPFFERFTDRRYAGPFRYEKQVVAGVGLFPDPDDTKQIRGLYDGAVAAVDDASSRILDELARLGVAKDTIVIVTSDHGETLFEHDRWHGHGDHLFGDESVHVPLAIYDPRTPLARREPAVVATVDFAPTLYELTGVAGPSGVDGRSLAAAVKGERIESRIAFAETELWIGWNPGLPNELRVAPPPLFGLLEVDTDHGTMVAVRREAAAPNLVGRHRMARDERYKLLYMPTPKSVEWRLYDTVADPDELVDVKDAAPAEAERLRDALWTWMLEDPAMAREGDRLVWRGR